MRHPDEPHPAFARRFLAALPPDLAATFTQAQLMAVQRCFGLRHGGRHAIDLRRSFWTPFGRFYLVLLAGAERRAPDRRSFERMLRSGFRGANALVSAGLVLAALLALLGVLHVAKLMLGIDIVPGIDMLPDQWLVSVLR